MTGAGSLTLIVKDIRSADIGLVSIQCGLICTRLPEIVAMVMICARRIAGRRRHHRPY